MAYERGTCTKFAVKIINKKGFSVGVSRLGRVEGGREGVQEVGELVTRGREGGRGGGVEGFPGCRGSYGRVRLQRFIRECQVAEVHTREGWS